MSEADISPTSYKPIDLLSRLPIPRGADEKALRRTIKQMHRALNSSRPYRAVVFDAERTLVHRTRPAVGEIIYLLELLSAHGASITEKQWGRVQHTPLAKYFPKHPLARYAVGSAFMRGLSPQEWLQCAEQEFAFQLTPEARDNTLDQVTAYFDSHVDWVPGARELVAELRAAGIKVAVTTDVDYIANYAVRRLLEPAVDVFISSFETGLKKPEPAIFQLALARLGSTPVTTLYVGDGGSTEMEGAGFGHPDSPWENVRLGIGMDTSLILHPDGYAMTHPGDRHCREAAMAVCDDIKQVRRLPRLAMALSDGRRTLSVS